MTKIPRPPVGLGPRGRRLFRRVVAAFNLTDGELEVLSEAARCADRLDALRAALLSEPLMVEGSKGQQIVHPAVAESRLQADLLARLLRGLALPSEDPADDAGRQLGRAGAAARWYGPGRTQGRR